MRKHKEEVEEKKEGRWRTMTRRRRSMRVKRK